MCDAVTVLKAPDVFQLPCEVLIVVDDACLGRFENSRVKKEDETETSNSAGSGKVL